ncbi:hypothetical protein KNSL1_005073 [Colletotrichum chrysophilum]|nr:hypothetical protein KNSL1_005073 [Colletotrichum chrysophilum]
MLIDPEEHKQRRNTVKSLFSTRQMDQLAPSILDVVRRAMNRAQRSYDGGAPLNIQASWSSVTVDTIMSVLFDRQMNFVDSDEEMPPFLDAMTKFADNFLLTKHFPLMNRLAVGLPMSIAGIGLSLGTYYLLKNPEKLNKMLDELKTVKTNAEGLFEYRELCNLPYLSTVSQAIRTIHDNPDIFPEPQRFIPERWLGENGWELEKWFVPFSKGTRACIGLNVAYMEMYLCLANLFTRFNMSLYKTDDNTTQWADGPAARIRESVKVNIDSIKM